MLDLCLPDQLQLVNLNKKLYQLYQHSNGLWWYRVWINDLRDTWILNESFSTLKVNLNCLISSGLKKVKQIESKFLLFEKKVHKSLKKTG